MGKHKTTASRKGAGRAADSVEKVYEAIKDLAVDYRFKPGERINEVELAAGLGVSRTPVREALNRLTNSSFSAMFHATTAKVPPTLARGI